MNCGLNLACHFAGAFAPISAFIDQWAWLGWFVLGLILGGILGWRVVVAILTAGVGYFLLKRFKPEADPDWETGEPSDPDPKKRRVRR